MSDPSKPFGSRHTHRARIAAMSRAGANYDEIEDVRILLRSARLAEYVQTALDLGEARAERDAAREALARVEVLADIDQTKEAP